MRRKSCSYTVDFFSEHCPAPKAGDLVRRLSAEGKERGFLRVLSSRQVRVKVSRGEMARYTMTVERLAEQPEGEEVTFTVHGYRKRPKTPARDKFSPLLPS